MAQCLNCKSRLSCGCQRRTASNGSSVCTKCISAYESRLKSAATTKKKFIPSKSTAPVNVTATYKPS